MNGFPHSPPLHREVEIMVIAGIPTDQLLHTRAAQDLLDRGRQEGEAQGEARGRALGEATVTLRQLNRRCGPLAKSRPPAFRLFRCSSWRPCPRRCLISPARPIWPCGWLSTLAERQGLLGLQAVKALAANGVFGIRGRGHLVRRHSQLAAEKRAFAPYPLSRRTPCTGSMASSRERRI